KKSLKAYMIALIFDYLSITIPYVLFMTVSSYTCSNTASPISMQKCLAFEFCLISRAGIKHALKCEAGSSGSARAYISSYRVSMMLATCISILAVDFEIFPRRLAKTETYGSSLMDLGVGSFVFANALVSRQARGLLNMSLGGAIRSSSPLIILGFARLISTSTVNYQVHVGEYGVHWNFFFSLAAVAMLTSIFRIHPHNCAVVGSTILIGYQAALLSGLNKYILFEERGHNIFSQNKEGILSILGYWGLYLIGVRIGNYFFIGGSMNQRRARGVWTLCLFFWLLTLFLDKNVEKISRRMCNMAYVSLTLACNLEALAIIMVPGSRSSVVILEDAFDRNSLACFLAANVLTGVVNLCVDTLSVKSASAVFILLGYTFALCGVAGCADFLGVVLKFW
ncbi:hypothetical protein M569_10598, partial [Genlisea aurea]